MTCRIIQSKMSLKDDAVVEEYFIGIEKHGDVALVIWVIVERTQNMIPNIKIQWTTTN